MPPHGVLRPDCRHPERPVQPHAAGRDRPPAGMLGQGRVGDRRRRGHDRRRRPGRRSATPHTIRDITVETGDAADWPRLTDAVNAVPGARVLDTTDRTFMLHMGGKIEVANKQPLKTRDDLSMAYTPGVARVCAAIRDDPDKAFQYTIKRNTVAVVSDGTAVLGPGRHRPPGGDAGDGGQGDAVQGVRRRGRLPGLPGHHATSTRSWPWSRRSRPSFGGINLEDISAPRCFEIEVAAAGRAGHPRLPRRPARDRGGGAGGPAERADADRAADRRHPGRGRGPRRRRASRWRRSCSRPACAT